MQHVVILSPSLDLQVPSILSEELQYNLFMNPRSGGTDLKDALGLPHHTNDASKSPCRTEEAEERL